MRHHRIVLRREECTSCDICVRECPTRCISITSHQEIVDGGARPKKVNVLDDFVLDQALCMHCGVCIDQCPFDALAWDDTPAPATVTRPNLAANL